METFAKLNIAVVDIVSICIDKKEAEGCSGRMYSCYEKAPFLFQNEFQLVKKMDSLMDELNYPQAAMEIRSYHKGSGKQSKKPHKVMDSSQFLKERGKAGTFAVHVKYRQNATWQGELLWVEKNQKQNFRSVLEFLKLIDSLPSMQ